jgi:hypothetical protein
LRLRKLNFNAKAQRPPSKDGGYLKESRRVSNAHH